MSSNLLLNFVIYYILIFRLCESGVLNPYEERKYGKSEEKDTGLYSDDDKVDVLNAEDFKLRVFHQKHVTVVEFYNSWCGFCQNFAPVWKALADDVEKWRRIVRIAAINCADERNTQICREFEVVSYPTLRLFHTGYEEGIGQNMQKGSDADSIRTTIVRELRLQQLNNRGSSIVDLGFYNKSDVSALWINLTNDIKYVFIIFQADNITVIGHEIALDLNDIRHITVRTVLDNSNLANSLNIQERPAVAVLARNAQQSVIKLSPKEPTREEFRKSIEVFLRSHQIQVPKEADNKTSRHWKELEIPDSKQMLTNLMTDALEKKVKSMGDAVFQSDLESAVRYSIFQEIPKRPIIANEQLIALQQYVSVLAKYFHMGPAGRRFLDRLDDSLQRMTEINGQDFYALVKTLEEDHAVFSTHRWLGCKGSRSGLRGYPCGMWTLFHHLTVQAAENQISDNPTAQGQEILQAMHGYIKNFFGCAECSKHFQEMASRRNIWNVVGADEAILWLWSAHNEVNNRLSGDLTEDPEHPKIQFPSYERCPECRKNEGGDWHHYKVLDYLKQLHERANISLLDVDLSAYLDQKPVFSAASITKLDFNICVLMYIVCGALLFVAIKVFLKKKYKKKSYPYDILGKI